MASAAPPVAGRPSRALRGGPAASPRCRRSGSSCWPSPAAGSFAGAGGGGARERCSDRPYLRAAAGRSRSCSCGGSTTRGSRWRSRLTSDPPARRLPSSTGSRGPLRPSLLRTSRRRLARPPGEAPYPPWSSRRRPGARAIEREPVLGTGSGVLVRPALSGAIVGAGISGIFSPFTQEAHVAAHLPPADLLFTACHELAHAQGWAREDEANYLAWRVGSRASSAELRAAARLLALGHVLGALGRADRGLLRVRIDGLDPGVRVRHGGAWAILGPGTVSGGEPRRLGGQRRLPASPGPGGGGLLRPDGGPAGGRVARRGRAASRGRSTLRSGGERIS